MHLSKLPAYQSKYLKAEDLKGRQVKIRIAYCEVAESKKYMSNEVEQRGFLHFEGTSKILQLSKSNVTTLEGAFGEDSEQFSNREVLLTPERTNNGKDTIVIYIPGATKPPATIDEVQEDNGELTEEEETRMAKGPVAADEEININDIPF